MNTDTSGLVLAGGLARRMGGVDKALVPFRGRPMLATVLARLQPQVAEVFINANHDPQGYTAFACPIVPDLLRGFAGPLAGLQAGLAATARPWLVTVPCDSPLLPLDLVARLHAGRAAADADVAVAVTAGQPHPVFALVRQSLGPHLDDFLAGGGRKIDRWYASLRVAEVAFDDGVEAFANVNTADELARLEQLPATP